MESIYLLYVSRRRIDRIIYLWSLNCFNTVRIYAKKKTKAVHPTRIIYIVCSNKQNEQVLWLALHRLFFFSPFCFLWCCSWLWSQILNSKQLIHQRSEYPTEFYSNECGGDGIHVTNARYSVQIVLTNLDINRYQFD